MFTPPLPKDLPINLNSLPLTLIPHLTDPLFSFSTTRHNGVATRRRDCTAVKCSCSKTETAGVAETKSDGEMTVLRKINIPNCKRVEKQDFVHETNELELNSLIL
jgi:hypothetical protein